VVVIVVVVVPAEFSETLHRYTSCGLRVIAFAMKSLDSSLSWRHVQRISRYSLHYTTVYYPLVVVVVVVVGGGGGAAAAAIV